MENDGRDLIQIQHCEALGLWRILPEHHLLHLKSGAGHSSSDTCVLDMP